MDLRARRLAVALVGAAVLSACTARETEEQDGPAATSTGATEPQAGTSGAVGSEPAGAITVAVAGDVHFEGSVADLVGRGRDALGPISRTLRAADVAMVNLETAVTDHERRDPKELERAPDRYHFRAPARALDVLVDSGVDVVSVANNHAGDFGRTGLLDTLAAGRARGLAMVGAGRDAAEAFTPHVVAADGFEVAVLAADTVQREGAATVWGAEDGAAGIAAARGSRTARLLEAVEAASARDQVVVVYLHWGKEYLSCPTQSQRLLVRHLAAAGADAVVGSHSHVLGGAGWAGDTYVAYGLGNFAWYHARQAQTGVLTLTLGPDGVTDEAWTPARISAADGRPLPLTGRSRTAAMDDWEGRSRCTGLADRRGEQQEDDPDYASSVSAIDADLAARMTRSHRPGCPVPLRDLRDLRMTHRDHDGRARTGEMVVHRRWARGVTEAFGRLYAAGWPVARMRLVDDYGADDDASMAADNTSGFNCRRVAGSTSWSQHAYGAAIDLNPLRNPYVRPGRVDPPAGRRFAFVDRSRSATVAPGVIRGGDLPVTAFGRIGWQWGGYWRSSQDYQHLEAPGRP